MIDRDAVHIDGNAFADALVSGIHRVMGQQELLNRINVFPVADSDTGTNLSLSLSAALGILGNDGDKHLGATLTATADALLDGARGNSGAIIAQFFQGMSDSAGELSRFTTQSFGDAVRLGSKYAHDALSAPREGTILTAIAAFAGTVAAQAANRPAGGFEELLGLARSDLDQAVANTPNQLDVLKKAGVVDAGAKGFAELVAGFADDLCLGMPTPLPDTAVLATVEAHVEFSAADNTSKYRYCTECLVSGGDIDRRKLRESLSALGDSLVLAGSKQKAKIHIHADEPESVFAAARDYGSVSGEKADDMHRQQRATHSRPQAFAVITDSAADIADDDAERLDIHMVPCRIQFGNRAYLDKVSITVEEFYDELRNNPNHPTSSQPSPGDFRRQFQFLASHFNDVLSINLTSRASGTYEGALSAAKRSAASERIHIIDSRNASLGQGMLAVLAAECAAAGFSLQRTREVLEDQIPKTRTFALLKDLRFAVRGGRLPRWVRTMADIMRVTPVLAFKPDGSIGLAGCLLGRRHRVRKFARFVAAEQSRGTTLDIGVGHAVCPQDAERLVAELRALWPGIRTMKTCPLGTGLGVHGGPGTLIVTTRPAVSVDDFAVRDN